MSTAGHTADLAARSEALEEMVALLVAERHGAASDTSELRRQVRAAMPAFVAQVCERVRERVIAQTEVVPFTGKNLSQVREFVGDSATVSEDAAGAALWLVSDGKSMRVAPGTWLGRDPLSGRIFRTEPTFEEVA